MYMYVHINRLNAFGILAVASARDYNVYKLQWSELYCRVLILRECVFGML